MSSPPATDETRETERGRGEKRVSFDQNQRGNMPHFWHAGINIYREEDSTSYTHQIIKYLLVFFNTDTSQHAQGLADKRRTQKKICQLERRLLSKVP